MNKLSRQVITNIISIIIILLASFCVFKTINFVVSLFANNFSNVLISLPLIISGCSLYALLLFYFLDAYIKFVSFKSRFIYLSINALFNLIAIILYFVSISGFIKNIFIYKNITQLFFFIISLASIVFDILSILFAKNGKYSEEFFEKNHYFTKINKLDCLILAIDGIFTSYALFSMIVLLFDIKNITLCPFGFVFLFVALHMSALSFITILIDKAKNYPILKIIVTSLNFFAILLVFIYEIIEPGYFLVIANDISILDYCTKIPFLFYLLIIDLIIKMIFIVQQSIKK